VPLADPVIAHDASLLVSTIEEPCAFEHGPVLIGGIHKLVWEAAVGVLGYDRDRT